MKVLKPVPQKDKKHAHCAGENNMDNKKTELNENNADTNETELNTNELETASGGGVYTRFDPGLLPKRDRKQNESGNDQ